jgi:PHP family Zn ribbon phosphoesterase
VDAILQDGRTEFGVLLDESESTLMRVASPEIVEAILAMRSGKVRVRPGYDGVFGEVRFTAGKRPEQGRIEL